jgi:hypothetical protein
MTAFLDVEQRSAFAEKFNRASFRFDHALHREPMFEVPELVEVSKRLPDSYFSTSDVAIEDGWGTAAREPKSLQETIANVASSNSLILLKGLAEDGEFGPTFRHLLSEFEEFVGDTLRTDVSVGRATLIISSPGRVTPYHVDAEANFLLQLRGEKIVHIFDPTDRTLLTDRELEAFYGGDPSAAKYKPERQCDAAVFDFAPGQGLHLPILAPHWTKNGDSVSVAISINCSLHSNKRVADVYKFNHLMRKRGFAPAAPGESHWRDRLKSAAVEGLGYVRRIGSRGVTTPVAR